MRRWMYVAFLGLVAGLLAGCTGWMQGSFAVVKPHAEAYDQTEPPEVEIASSYEGLKETLSRLAANCVTQVTLDVTQYGERVEEDLPRACRELKKSDPLVAYAVERFQTELQVVGARQLAAVEITYCRTPEQVQSIVRTWGVSGMESKLQSAMDDAETSLVLRVSGYQAVDLNELAYDYYEKNLDKIMECPVITAVTYPATGSNRILEIQFQYSTSRETQLKMRREVQVMLSSAAGYVAGQQTEQGKAALLWAFLEPLFSKAGPSSTPVYSLLCMGLGDSHSVATVYSLLCSRAGLTCQVVSGAHSNREWYWNIVTLDGVSYHVDLLTDQEAGEITLRYDEDMTAYRWDREAYPACPAPEAPPETEPAGSESTQATQPPTDPPEETTEPEEIP